MKGYPILFKLPPNLGWLLLIIGIIIVMLTSSCSPDFYCRKCPVKDSSFTSIHDTTIVHDTIIKVEERSVTIHDTVPCDDFVLNKDSNGVNVKVIVKDKIIYVKATCAALELKLKIYEKVRTIRHYRELTRFVSKDVRPSWWTYYQTWVMILIVAAIVTLKILKLVYKWPIPFL